MGSEVARVALLSPVELVNALLADALRATGRVDVVVRGLSHEQVMKAAGETLDLILVYDGSTSSRVQELPVILAALNTSRVVVFGLFESRADPAFCAASGAHCLLARDATLTDLTHGIETVHMGGAFYSPSVVHALESGRHGTHGYESLTRQERAVFALIGRGLSNREIAAALPASIGTVKTHVHRILEKLHLTDRQGIRALASGAGPGEGRASRAAHSGGEGSQDASRTGDA